MFVRNNWFRYLKFIFGGGLSMLLNLALTYILTEYFDLWHMVSYTISLVLEILFLFVYHSLVTFRGKGRFLYFVATVLFISGLNWAAVYVMTVVFKIYYPIAILIAALTFSMLNYFINRKIGRAHV